MRFLYAIVLVLVVLVSARGQQTQVQTQQPIQADVQPVQETAPVEESEAEEDKEKAMEEVKEGLMLEEIRILGKAGFDPAELKVITGAAVTWINDDKKGLLLTIFKDGKFYLNSAVIKSGEKFEHEFKDKGTYEYWTLAYGPKGAKIVVE